MVKETGEYDLVVLGAGPAGLTAGIYASRYGLRVLVISKDIGGMLNYAEILENYPGFTGSGIELARNFAEQAKKFGAEIQLRDIVNLKRTGDDIFEVQTLNNETVKSKAIIFALGTEKRKLNVEGEEGLLGQGVSYCALCDAPLFKDKVVAVVGGRNSAAHAALLISRYAKQVYVVYRKEKLRCDDFLLGSIEKHENIKLVYNATPLKIEGKEKVEKIVIDVNGKKQESKVDGVFVEIGSVPISGLARKLGIKIDNEGYIIADREMRTSIDGVFAAGDITQGSIKQVVTAAAQGAIAASSAYKFLKEKKYIKPVGNSFKIKNGV